MRLDDDDDDVREIKDLESDDDFEKDPEVIEDKPPEKNPITNFFKTTNITKEKTETKKDLNKLSTTSKSTTKNSNPSNKPWVEKYRPKNVDEISHQAEVVSTLKKSLETNNLPHLLFYGPAGCGKTSAILAICNQLFGPEYFGSRVLELNASDERGIDVIRNKVKKFAQISVGQKPHSYPYPLPPFKVIILDEADSMTIDAQSALRRTMEKYSKVTRLCLICNYISRIIEPITSRCAKFRFKALDEVTMSNRLSFISQLENMEISDDVLHTIGQVSGGDLRRAITLLQSSHVMHGKDLTVDHVKSLAGVIPTSIIEGFYKNCCSKNFQKLQKSVEDFLKEGFSAKQFLMQLLDFLLGLDEKECADDIKARMAIKISECEKCLIDGADEYLQLMDLGSLFLSNKNL